MLLRRLEAEADEMWSFGEEKGQQAMELDRNGRLDRPDDRRTYVGDRSGEGAKALRARILRYTY